MSDKLSGFCSKKFLLLLMIADSNIKLNKCLTLTKIKMRFLANYK